MSQRIWRALRWVSNTAIITFLVIRSTIPYPISAHSATLCKDIPFLYASKRFNAFGTCFSTGICVLFDWLWNTSAPSNSDTKASKLAWLIRVAFEINQADDTFRLTDCPEREMVERLVLEFPNTDLYTPIASLVVMTPDVHLSYHLLFLDHSFLHLFLPFLLHCANFIPQLSHHYH